MAALSDKKIRLVVNVVDGFEFGNGGIFVEKDLADVTEPSPSTGILVRKRSIPEHDPTSHRPNECDRANRRERFVCPFVLRVDQIQRVLLR